MDAVWFGLSLSVWFVYSAALLVVDAQLGGGGGGGSLQLTGQMFGPG